MKKTAIILSIASALALGGGAFWIASHASNEQTDAIGTASANADPRVIGWLDLLPEGEDITLPRNSASDFFKEYTTSKLAENPLMSAPAPKAKPRQDMADTFVKLAGYMTPFDVEAGKTSSFLLVPYIGACIHVPAPPANQIVLVETEEPVEIREMWHPFEAVGTLRIKNISTDLAEVAYTMELDRIEPYVFEDETN